MKGKWLSRGWVASALAVTSACGGDGFEAAREVITADELARGIRELAADSMEGRAPGTRGEERTARYLQRRFEGIGLEPGNGESWFQSVPLVSIEPRPAGDAVITGVRWEHRLRFGADLAATTERVVERVALDGSELVFAGYGIVAPEYGWNDYRDLDARGKTVVVLINDPGFATGDSLSFRGRAMTYYGRWSYKFEEAARQGAEGVLIVHQTEPAGYGWEVARTGWSGPASLLAERADVPVVAVQGWIRESAARSLLGQAGLDLDSLAALAARPGFRPVPLGLAVSLELDNEIRRYESRNVLARLPGRTHPAEHIVYMAHWDHLGMDETLDDPIYNGALDNASGTAGLIELARAFRALRKPPERSILFLAVTAEEQGLLGSAYYAAHPVVPLERTVAAINMDGLNIWGPTHDVTVVGFGMSELEDFLAEAAAGQGRVLGPDPEPEKGYFYRSDHFEFAKLGVPALYADPGVEDVERGESWGRQQRDTYVTESYHKPADEYDPSWNLEGAAADLRLLFETGYRLAGSRAWPNWREGIEFRAVRDGMMAGRNE